MMIIRPVIFVLLAFALCDYSISVAANIDSRVHTNSLYQNQNLQRDAINANKQIDNVTKQIRKVLNKAYDELEKTEILVRTSLQTKKYVEKTYNTIQNISSVIAENDKYLQIANTALNTARNSSHFASVTLRWANNHMQSMNKAMRNAEKTKRFLSRDTENNEKQIFAAESELSDALKMFKLLTEKVKQINIAVTDTEKAKEQIENVKKQVEAKTIITEKEEEKKEVVVVVVVTEEPTTKPTIEIEGSSNDSLDKKEDKRINDSSDKKEDFGEEKNESTFTESNNSNSNGNSTEFVPVNSVDKVDSSYISKLGSTPMQLLLILFIIQLV